MVESKRIDDKFLRKVTWTLLGFLLASAGTSVWVVASLQTRVGVLEKAVKEIKSLEETASKLDKSLSNFNLKVNYSNKTMARIEKQLTAHVGEHIWRE